MNKDIRRSFLLAVLFASGSCSRGPSLSETARWLQTELPELAGYGGAKVTATGNVQIVLSQVLSASIQQCHLVWEDTLSTSGSYSVESGGSTAVDLRTVDLRATGIEPDTSHILSSGTLWRLLFQTAEGGIRESSVINGIHTVDSTTRNTSIYFADSNAATRVTAAVLRAAELCGARRSPF